MKSIAIILSAALLWLCSTAPLSAASKQPHMRAAIDLLNAAKTAEKPIPVLRAARKELHAAKKDKGGERKDAMAAIDEAIMLATAGDKRKMLQKIDHAVAQVRHGIQIAR